MELHDFRYFLAVAEHLSFTEAAKHLGMTQPPLSRQIRCLEQELGTQLFERRSRKVFLTGAGLRFLKEARLVVEHASAALHAARSADGGELGSIRVAFGKGLGDAVSMVINQHLRMFPDVEIDVRDIISGLQLNALTDRKVDVGFLHGAPTSLDIVSQKLFSAKLFVVLPSKHTLAKRQQVRFRDLERETLLLIDRKVSPGVHDHTVALYRVAGLSPKVISTEQTCYDESGALMVASGKGIYLAVGKNPIHPSFADQLVALPLDETFAQIDVHVAWSKAESSSTVLRFVETARQLLTRQSGVVDLRYFPRIMAGESRSPQRKRHS